MKKPRTQEEIDLVKRQILDEALDIITESGFSSLTMRAIASGIGMTAPNIYNYFVGKDEIYITLVIQGFQTMYQQLLDAAASYDDLKEKGRAFIQTYLKFGMENASHYDIMFTQPTPKYDDYVGTPFQDLSEVELKISMDIAALAEKLIKEAGGADMEQEAVSDKLLAFWSMLHGMVSLHNSNVASYVVKDVRATCDRITEDMLNLFFPNL
ncbi:TetR/AcrR family transcriptional regulator [Desulfatibacillum aliphaticivorans]|uniref:Transcriptional regulator, TetR family n=1 Tax=Desulfatibacillum aliphaticivorans TaxID=218208 RepID=B8FIT2_DESAL|nr:TetR/AcrR family transcriptional regulator [Desulfatibacillum aliphaticivorans]ACL04323.1 transcriptional regulator, TetR family [Desulfatibacillum aliphaticivorans]